MQQNMNRNEYLKSNTAHTLWLCPRCHVQNTMRYCTQCGYDLQKAPQYQMPQASYQPYLASQPVQNAMYHAPMPATASQKKPTWHIWISLILLFLSLIIILFMLTRGVTKKLSSALDGAPFNPPTASSDGQDRPKSGVTNGSITIDELNQIKLGMSYAHVSQIIGDDGILVNNGTYPTGGNYYTYMWASETEPDAYAYITFEPDLVSDIMNDGVGGLHD